MYGLTVAVCGVYGQTKAVCRVYGLTMAVCRVYGLTMGVCGFHGLTMGVCGFHGVTMGVCGFHGLTIGVCGFHGLTMGVRGFHGLTVNVSRVCGLTVCCGFLAENEEGETAGQLGRKKHYETPQVPENELEEMIEEILHEDDTDNDGYVDYPEFMLAQKRRGGFDESDRPYSPDRY